MKLKILILDDEPIVIKSLKMALKKIDPEMRLVVVTTDHSDEDFQKSQKPLNFIAEHYLKYKRQMLFG